MEWVEKGSHPSLSPLHYCKVWPAKLQPAVVQFLPSMRLACGSPRGSSGVMWE